VQYTSPLQCSLDARGCAFDDYQTDLSVKTRLLHFGETNCSVQFTNCVIGACYFLLDLTSRYTGTSSRQRLKRTNGHPVVCSIPTDALERKLPTSIFESVNVTNAEFAWDRFSAPPAVAFRTR
jgi:hypothetical protein